MSVCPFDFKHTNEQKIDSLSLNYSFDITTSITTIDTTNVLNEGLSISQTPKAPAIILSLGGRTSKTVMTIGINGKTSGFNLYCAYITKVFPNIKKDKGEYYSFVIEGVSSNNVNGEKILIFIPLNKISTLSSMGSANVFQSIETALTNGDNLKEVSTELSIDFNKIIPESNYYYYTYTDSKRTIYNIITFDTSNLSYTSIFEKILSSSLNEKTTKYELDIKEKNTATLSYPVYMSTSIPVNQDVITKSFEDNIYIDCQPVDLLKNEGKNYLQTTIKEATGLITYLEVAFPYLILIVFLTLLIIFIYSISSFLKNFLNLTSKADASGIASEGKPMFSRMLGAFASLSSMGKKKPEA